MSEIRSLSFWGFLKGLVKAVIGTALLLQAFLFLFVLILLITLLGNVGKAAQSSGVLNALDVPEGAALVINPNGVLVEQAAEEDPFQVLIEEAAGQSRPSQIEIHDLVKAIREAKDDERVAALVLDLGGLNIPSIYASKMQVVAQEVEKFKESGKPVIAIGDYYSQEQYYIAAHADEVFMHHYGSIFVYGYGRYRTYYNELLTKYLKVTNHIFRVGTYKSALEPVLRNDMSDAAKEANMAYLNVLWNDYTAGVEKARELKAGTIADFSNNSLEYVRAAGGDLAQAAVNLGLVDELKSRKEQLEHIKSIVGEDEEGESFKRVGFRSYLLNLEEEEDGDAPNIAVVTVAGAIVDGNLPIGVAAGDRIAENLRQAREDEEVKAVVLRVDSGGGSAFASEVIRTEVLALKEAGKPVVVSMGSLAASGGYWVSANADEIWAAPTTVTGSIGIFGYIRTMENTVAQAGVYSDGVGTTDLSGITGAGLGPLPEEFGDLIQASIENGYERFLGIVGDARGFSRDETDAMAQGRVWIGVKAKELGLVDKLGYLTDALDAAAAKAGIEGEYDVVNFEETTSSPMSEFLDILTGMAMHAGIIEVNEPELFAGRPELLRSQSLRGILSQVYDEAEFYETFNDPNAVYARCLVCEPN